MQRLVIGLCVAAVLTGAKMLAHPAAAATDPASRAALVASILQAKAPETFDNAITITGAHAEDRTVVVTIRFEPTFPARLSVGQREHLFSALSCRQPAIETFVRSGGSFRYDMMRSDGSLYDSVSITSCEGVSPS